jgi:hypothetical protein
MNSSTRRTLSRVADRLLLLYIPVCQTCSAINRKERCTQIAQLLVQIISLSHRAKETQLLRKATSSTNPESIEVWLDWVRTYQRRLCDEHLIKRVPKITKPGPTYIHIRGTCFLERLRGKSVTCRLFLKSGRPPVNNKRKQSYRAVSEYTTHGFARSPHPANPLALTRVIAFLRLSCPETCCAHGCDDFSLILAVAEVTPRWELATGDVDVALSTLRA